MRMEGTLDAQCSQGDQTNDEHLESETVGTQGEIAPSDWGCLCIYSSLYRVRRSESWTAVRESWSRVNKMPSQQRPSQQSPTSEQCQLAVKGKKEREETVRVGRSLKRVCGETVMVKE